MAKACNEVRDIQTLTEVEKVIKTLRDTRKTIKTACSENNIEYSLFEEHSKVLQKLDQCSVCNHWRTINSLEQDNDGFPVCKICVEVYGI